MKQAEYARVVERLHGGRASFERVEHVVERHGGSIAWEGDVYVFRMAGLRSAERAYAWSEPIPDSTRRRFFAVLHQSPVTSPALAVRASIAQDTRGQPPRPPNGAPEDP